MRNALILSSCLAMAGFMASQERVFPTKPREQPYPARIESVGQDPRATAPYRWLAASEALDPDGNLREDLLFGTGPRWEKYRNKFVAAFEAAQTAETVGAVPPPCYVVSLGSPIGSQSQPHPRTVDELIALAEFAFSGTVTDTEPGFDEQFLPITVLTIRVKSWLLESPFYTATDTVFVTYPSANFYLGPLEICSSRDGFPPVPQVGSAVLITQPDTFDWEARAHSPEPYPFITFGYGFYAGPSGEVRGTEASSKFSMLANAENIDVAAERLSTRIQVRRRQ